MEFQKGKCKACGHPAQDHFRVKGYMCGPKVGPDGILDDRIHCTVLWTCVDECECEKFIPVEERNEVS